MLTVGVAGVGQVHVRHVERRLRHVGRCVV